MKSRHSYKSLLTHPEFINWVKDPDTDSNNFWNNWLKSNPERKEEFFRAREIILSLKFRSSEPPDHLQDDVLEVILRENVVASPTRSFPAFYRMAAAIVLIAVVSVLVWQFVTREYIPSAPAAVKMITKENPAGRKSQHRLPDGTRVWLNSESVLCYPETFADSMRIVDIQGEAFFDVMENSRQPFVVKAGNTSTRVLGTSFNLSTFDPQGQVKLSLLTGKVSFSNDEKMWTMKPGEELTYREHDRSVTKQVADVLTAALWKEGILDFSSAGIDEVTTRLERWFGIQIDMAGEPAYDWKYSGAFDNKSLIQVLDQLSFTEGFSYTIEDQVVSLKFKKTEL